jgi:hypothetical protein
MPGVKNGEKKENPLKARTTPFTDDANHLCHHRRNDYPLDVDQFYSILTPILR